MRVQYRRNVKPTAIAQAVPAVGKRLHVVFEKEVVDASVAVQCFHSALVTTTDDRRINEDQRQHAVADCSAEFIVRNLGRYLAGEACQPRDRGRRQ